MLTIMEIIEKAKLAGMEKFVDVDSVNRGWYVNLLSEEGKKVRMTEAELAEQEAFIQECFEEAKRADAPVPTIDTVTEVEEPKKPAKKATVKGVIVLEDENGEYEITQKLLDHIEIMKLAGKPVKVGIITCKDCGRRRMVKHQDMFQVDRCSACIKEDRNARRRKSAK